MTDDLRLRTARALGWEPAWQREEDGLLKEGWRYKDGRHGGGGMVIYGLPGRDVMECLGIPAYGASWACCEEIDAAIKARGWDYSVRARAVSRAVYGPLCGVRIEIPARGGVRKRMRCISEVQAPTFPAALALAFCQAVEANGE